MEIIRKISKPASIFLAFQMLMVSGIYQSVSAAMIDTESIINVDRGQNPRDYRQQHFAYLRDQVGFPWVKRLERKMYGKYFCNTDGDNKCKENERRQIIRTLTPRFQGEERICGMK